MHPLATDLFRATPMRPLAEAAALSVWDVGARGGIDPSLLPLAWCTRALAFEPDPAAAERLRAMGRGPWAAIDTVEAAIAGSDGPRTLRVMEDPDGSTLLAPRADVAARYGVAPLYRVAEQLDVPTMTLATAAATHGAAPPTFLKLDTEGTELESLHGAGGLLDHVAAIKTEAAFLQSRDNQPMAWEIANWLGARGFALMEIAAPTRWRRGNVACAPYVARQGGWSRGRLAQADLIFVRDRDRLEDEGGATSAAMRTALTAAALGYVDHARDILERPHAAEGFRTLTGSAPEPVLAAIARTAGRRDAARTIRARLRDLIPLIRSRFGGVPLPRS